MVIHRSTDYTRMEGSIEADAKAYDELSEHQSEGGIEFIRELNLAKGSKVLDMGCGTGSVTKYIADIVGPDGQVIGIDPDAARIKIAQEKYKEISSLKFHVGSSATGFPHDNEPYYDVHISTTAFHWVPDDEKKIYLQKAHQCLKPGGMLAILAVQKMVDNQSGYFLTPDGYQKLFQDVRLFTEGVQFKQHICKGRYKSLEEFKRWFRATFHKDVINPAYFTNGHIITKDDGVTLNTPYVSMIANKQYDKN